MGKFIDSSGICELMINCGLIARGSVGGIISGTHFNRCKKIHPIAALAFKIIHFKQFLENYEKSQRVNSLSVEEIINELHHENQTYATEQAKHQLRDVFDNFHSYTEETRQGLHGLTAQYTLMYVDSVDKYQLFEYAIRTSDLKLYIHAARKMCTIFFRIQSSKLCTLSVKEY